MPKKMDRLQFYLEPELNRKLDELSRELNVSKAQLVREGVRKVIYERAGRSERPGLGIIGMLDKTPRHDAPARNHNEIIYCREAKGREGE